MQPWPPKGWTPGWIRAVTFSLVAMEITRNQQTLKHLLRRASVEAGVGAGLEAEVSEKATTTHQRLIR